MRPASLRWRLAGWVALVVVLSTGVTFVAVYRGTGTQLHRQIDSEIEGDAGALAHALASSGARTPRQTLSAARDYVGGQPFSASSTLLFATVPGAGTATNTPELFGNPTPDDGESVAVQEQENRLSHRLLTVGGGSPPWTCRTSATCACSSAECARSRWPSARRAARDDRRGGVAGERGPRPAGRGAGVHPCGPAHARRSAARLAG